MRRSGWTPSIVPGGYDQTVYLVMEDLGRLGRVWPEADVENSDVETIIVDLLDAQYGSPLCVIAFNAAERWSRDVSEDIARELLRRCDLEGRKLPEGVQDFVERYAGNPTQLTLRPVRPG
jgi:hypothetical protein